MRESAMVLADLGTPEDRTGPDIYAACYNLTGTSQHEVARGAARGVVGPPSPFGDWEVIIRGLSRAKTVAIVMILNAPEG